MHMTPHSLIGVVATLYASLRIGNLSGLDNLSNDTDFNLHKLCFD